MLWILFFYILLPFALSALLVRLIQQRGASTVPEAVRRHFAASPPAKRSFRVLRVEGDGTDPSDLRTIGDYEEQDAAVDAAAQSNAASPGRTHWVLNDRGEILREF